MSLVENLAYRAFCALGPAPQQELTVLGLFIPAVQRHGDADRGLVPCLKIQHLFDASHAIARRPHFR
jgi:hypothetical protein